MLASGVSRAVLMTTAALSFCCWLPPGCDAQRGSLLFLSSPLETPREPTFMPRAAMRRAKRRMGHRRWSSGSLRVQ